MGSRLVLAYYKFPYGHWKRIRTLNPLERTFREVRQRVRVIGRFKDEERAQANSLVVNERCPREMERNLNNRRSQRDYKNHKEYKNGGIRDVL